jgi:hypothetical protein
LNSETIAYKPDKLFTREVLEGLLRGTSGDCNTLAEKLNFEMAQAYSLFSTIGNIQHIGLPTSRLGRFLSADKIHKIGWCIVPSASADARIDRHTQARTELSPVDRIYLIQISVGTILRIASLCNEVAAVAIDHMLAAPLTSLEPPGLFLVTPSSAAGKQYAKVLTSMALILLFGHEATHAIDGHSDYEIENRNMPIKTMSQLERAADQGAGLFLMSRMLNLNSLTAYFGYAANEQLPDEVMKEQMIRDAIVASLILSTYLQPGTGSASELYDPALIRFTSILSGFKSYINANDLPIQDNFEIDPLYMDSEKNKGNIDFAHHVLQKTSAAELVRRMFKEGVPAMKDPNRLRQNGTLYSKLNPLRPLGLRIFIEKYQKATRRRRNST